MVCPRNPPKKFLDSTQVFRSLGADTGHSNPPSGLGARQASKFSGPLNLRWSRMFLEEAGLELSAWGGPGWVREEEKPWGAGGFRRSQWVRRGRHGKALPSPPGHQGATRAESQSRTQGARTEQGGGACCFLGNNKVLQSRFLPRLLTSNKILLLNNPRYCSAT